MKYLLVSNLEEISKNINLSVNMEEEAHFEINLSIESDWFNDDDEMWEADLEEAENFDKKENELEKFLEVHTNLLEEMDWEEEIEMASSPVVANSKSLKEYIKSKRNRNTER